MRNPIEKKIAEELGYGNHKPYVQFYDHAVLNQARSEEAGRPKYDAKVYIQKTPSAPDLAVRNNFSRKMIEADKHEFPEEWAHYCAKKKEQDNFNPLVTGIPGMTVTAAAELKDLRIVTCRDLANYDGDLDDLEPLRDIARQVLDIGDRIRAKPAVQAPRAVPAPIVTPVSRGKSFHYEFQV